MTKRMLTSALCAGLAAGLLAALLHFAFIQNLILLGEQYETGQTVHFGTAAAPSTEVGHDHTTPAAATAAHDHGTPPSTLWRKSLTALFTVLLYTGYGLLLVAGFALAEHFGTRITARDGVLWGGAGFIAVQLAPAMGLAPELPGTPGAELVLRQIWWLGTIAATATGIALLAYGRGISVAVLGAALLAAPHVIGAPQTAQFAGVAPPELAAAFAARVLGTSLAAWLLLGSVAGHFWTQRTT
ncbi:MAG: CbtA family protein [Pseudorhodobacter sp.]|nr:CbtA family protein [Pseudorhodobacter sp.]